jgi:hypothetical protein
MVYNVIVEIGRLAEAICKKPKVDCGSSSLPNNPNQQTLDAAIRDAATSHGQNPACAPADLYLLEARYYCKSSAGIC